jgi:dTDP-D-glucose 4,6-dehydratase
METQPMKVFVTGGAGFIGSNFIRLVLASEKQYANMPSSIMTS